MSDEPLYVVCSRVEARHLPLRPGAVFKKCSECGARVVFNPATEAVAARFPVVVIICDVCLASHPDPVKDILPLTDGQLLEVNSRLPAPLSKEHLHTLVELHTGGKVRGEH